MDAANLRDLRALAAAADADRIRLFGEIADLGGRDVPDPYYGTADDFAAVLALLETGIGFVGSGRAQLQGNARALRLAPRPAKGKPRTLIPNGPG